MVRLMDCTLRDGANVVGKGFDAEITKIVLDILTESNVPIIEFGNAGGIGAYEVAGFTNALTDMEYLDLVQPYLGKSEIGMFLNAKRFREPNVELAASKGMKFLRCGADAGDARKISEVPVKTIKGEKPVKAGGKLLVIDGGFSKAYQPETGIAGYTLIFHSRGLQLTQHEPFQSAQKAIEEGIDIISTSFILELNSQRMMVRDTDIGKELETQIKDLKKLLIAYRNGFIKEKS